MYSFVYIYTYGSDGKESAFSAGDWVPSLGLEYPLENGMATNSSILVWRILGTEESGGLQSMGLQRVRHDWVIKLSLLLQIVICLF